VTVEEVRALILAHAGVVESQHHSQPDFRVNERIVVNLDERARAITVKLDAAQQALLVASLPANVVSLPGGWAKHGWTTISFERAPFNLIRELIADAVRFTPKRAANRE
jgi:YjbR